jgi:hypothetical protein
MFTFESIISRLPAEYSDARYLDFYSGTTGVEEFRHIADEVSRTFPTHMQPHPILGALIICTTDEIINVSGLVETAQDKPPYTVFIVTHDLTGQTTSIGALQDARNNPLPFVSYIETMQGFRSQGYAERMLGYMSALSHVIYDMPLSSGLESYFSPDGARLAEAVAAKHNLPRTAYGQFTER